MSIIVPDRFATRYICDSCNTIIDTPAYIMDEDTALECPLCGHWVTRYEAVMATVYVKYKKSEGK